MSALTLEQTRRFLNILAPSQPVTFQTYSDHDDLKVKHPNGKTTDPKPSQVAEARS